MKDTFFKWFDFLAEGLWKNLLYPILMWFWIITVLTFLVLGTMLIAHILGISDFQTMMTAFVNFMVKPW